MIPRTLIVRILRLAAWLILGGLALPAHADTVPRVALTIPFTHQAGHNNVIVRIRINDGLTGNFLLDTGAYASMIDPDFVKRARLSAEASPHREPAELGGQRLSEVQIPRLTLGNLTLTYGTLYIEPDNSFLRSNIKNDSEGDAALGTQLRMHQRIDGILGMDIMQHFALLIDFDQETITVWPHGNLTRDDLQNAGMTQAVTASLTQHDDWGNDYYTKVGFETETGRDVEDMEIDTGAEETLIAPHLADTIKIAAAPAGYTHTFYGLLPISHGSVDRVTIDGLTIPRVNVDFTRSAPSDFPALLGLNALERCSVLFDFPSMKMYLQVRPDGDGQTPSQTQFSQTVSYQAGPNGEVLLPVQFAGGATGTFAVSVGSSRSIVSPGLAARLGLTPKIQDAADASAASVPAGPVVRLAPLRFAGIGVSSLDCSVSAAALTVAGVPVDGILGHDLLSNFLVYIDFSKHEITFLEGLSLKSADLRRLGMLNVRAAELPLIKPPHVSSSSIDLPAVPVQLQSDRWADDTFLVSTLDARTTLSPSTAQSLAAKGTQPVALSAFEIAGLEIPAVTSVQAPPDATALPASVLGLDVLSQYRVLLDYPEGHLYLAPPEKARATLIPMPDKKP